VLHSTRYTAFRQEVARHFDWVILDAPPVLSAADARALARHADGVLLVVAAETTPRRTVLAAIDWLNAFQARVVGAVLNHVRPARTPAEPLLRRPRHVEIQQRHGAA